MHVSGISFYQQQLQYSAVSRNVKRNVSPIARLRSLSSSSHLTLEDAVLLSTGEKKIGEDIVSEFYIIRML